MTKIKIASWNVNSVKARLENLVFWLKETKPDVVLLQELKCVEADFPLEVIVELGYNVAVWGQKSYNGVAIISRFPVQDVVRGLPGFEDEQARYIEAVVVLPNCAIRVASIYVPNGGAELVDGKQVNETDKFIYKMRFFDGLKKHLQNLLCYNEIAIFGGDYNVGFSEIDVYDSVRLDGSVCFHRNERKKMRQILNLGYVDCFRELHPDVQAFSWWDYRGNSWNYNKGLRIDYLLASPKAADFLIEAFMDDRMMMERERPSDHCPVVGVWEVC